MEWINYLLQNEEIIYGLAFMVAIYYIIYYFKNNDAMAILHSARSNKQKVVFVITAIVTLVDVYFASTIGSGHIPIIAKVLFHGTLMISAYLLGHGVLEQFVEFFNAMWYLTKDLFSFKREGLLNVPKRFLLVLIEFAEALYTLFFGLAINGLNYLLVALDFGKFDQANTVLYHLCTFNRVGFVESVQEVPLEMNFMIVLTFTHALMLLLLILFTGGDMLTNSLKPTKKEGITIPGMEGIKGFFHGGFVINRDKNKYERKFPLNKKFYQTWIDEENKNRLIISKLYIKAKKMYDAASLKGEFESENDLISVEQYEAYMDQYFLALSELANLLNVHADAMKANGHDIDKDYPDQIPNGKGGYNGSTS